MPRPGWKHRKNFSLKMQKIACRTYYPIIWPGYHITEIDELPGDLALTIDIGGADKLRTGEGGHLIFVAQRFRKSNDRYRDFTIREAEYNRHILALQNGGFIPGFYVYGYANKAEDDFEDLYVIDYPMWLTDVSAGIVEMRYKQPYYDPKQENFYYYALKKIPDPYILYRTFDWDNPVQLKMFG